MYAYDRDKTKYLSIHQHRKNNGRPEQRKPNHTKLVENIDAGDTAVISARSLNKSIMYSLAEICIYSQTPFL